MPTGLAARDNEIKQRRDLSESIFREWLPADAVRDGAIHDWAMTKAQRGEPPQCMLPGSGIHENGQDLKGLTYSGCQKDGAAFHAALVSSDTGKFYRQESLSV